MKLSLCLNHFCGTLAVVGQPLLQPLQGRESVCPEAAFVLGSVSVYLHILSCSLLWAQIGLNRNEKGMRREL